jgi:hypothetical protein
MRSCDPYVLRDEIARRILGGSDVDTVERAVIEPAALGDDEKAALWLLAWCLANGLPSAPWWSGR